MPAVESESWAKNIDKENTRIEKIIRLNTEFGNIKLPRILITRECIR